MIFEVNKQNTIITQEFSVFSSCRRAGGWRGWLATLFPVVIFDDKTAEGFVASGLPIFQMRGVFIGPGGGFPAHVGGKSLSSGIPAPVNQSFQGVGQGVNGMVVGVG